MKQVQNILIIASVVGVITIALMEIQTKNGTRVVVQNTSTVASTTTTVESSPIQNNATTSEAVLVDAIEVPTKQLPTPSQNNSTELSSDSVEQTSDMIYADTIYTDPTIDTTPEVTFSTNTYTNGTYSQSNTYNVPHGTNEIAVTLTLTDDIITNLTVTHTAQHRESQQYQNRFDKRIADQVVGSSIDDISVSRIGGASLTTRAFNAAVAAIRIDAV